MRAGKIGVALVLGAAAAAFAPAPVTAQVRPDTAHGRHRAPTPAPRDTARANRAPAPVDSARARRAAPPADSAHAAHQHAPGMQMPAPADSARRRRAGMHDAMSGPLHAGMHMDMLMRPLGGGWRLLGMAQAFSMVTWVAPRDRESQIHDSEGYVTQPTVMVNLEGPGSRVVVRSTLNLEAVTQPGGEYNFGGWGEGFIDKRHPHTVLHEAMVSLNAWRAPGGVASLSAGKGFAAYGTDDPMSRPVAKYPTNHHLSQLLERWTVTGAWLPGPWSVEASVFGGGEPDGPWDLGNVSSFGNSFSVRLGRRFGGVGTTAPWEITASAATVAESHDGETERTALYNAAVRHSWPHSFGGIYALAEASMSDPEEGEGVWSLVGETQVRIGRHRPYYRVEYATRPEYPRQGAPGEPGFFRYDHDDEPIGATRWLIQSLGYEFDLSGGGVATRPYLEAQYHHARPERGGVEPEILYGSRNFWTVSAGFRLFFGGGPMRMGSYGVLDDMTLMHHPIESPQTRP
jgi:hypothetical protein